VKASQVSGLSRKLARVGSCPSDPEIKNARTDQTKMQKRRRRSGPPLKTKVSGLLGGASLAT
jgi:hypothetical protein